MDKIGPIFGESISTEKIKRRNYGDPVSSRGMRYYFIPLILVIAITLLVVRLILLQVIQGNYYRNLANSNRIKTIIIHAPRGTIFDRSGNPLVYNVPGFRQTVNGKTKLIGRDEAISLLAKNTKNLEIDSLRQYPYKDSMVHLLGYLGQVSPSDLKTPAYRDYLSGDVVGKMGIEKEYESLLKGEDGKQLGETDSMGKVVRKLGQTDPIPGKNIRLTIDKSLQQKAYNSMKNIKKGAVIASTPKGEILAIVSKPSFDPNLFTQGSDYKVASDSAYPTVTDVLQDLDNQPFLNRAIGGVYPPGSTFKIVVAAAGLASNVIDTNYSIKDTGIIRINEFSFANWFYTDHGGTDGEVNVIKGLKRSNDIFFYKLAEKIGVDRLSSVSEKFGLGKILGIDLDGEQSGLVPTREWKQKVIGEPWYLGDTYHYGIGQGYLLTTPLQVNVWTQSVANNGKIYRPHILKDIGDEVLAKNIFDSKTTNPVRQGMIEACQTGGVAYPLFEFKVKNSKLKVNNRDILKVATGSADLRQIVVACKTGTAQHGGEQTKPHAWITLFAPANNPQIVLTVLAEESGEGSGVAAPIAKEILTEWFSRQIKN